MNKIIKTKHQTKSNKKQQYPNSNTYNNSNHQVTKPNQLNTQIKQPKQPKTIKSNTLTTQN